jgi:hypothetical protein
VVRSLFIWEAYEGVRNLYEPSYLEYFLQVVDELAQQDIYTIVDIHQARVFSPMPQSLGPWGVHPTCAATQ